VRASRESRPPERRAFDTAKLVLAGVGLFVWLYGVRVDDERFRWAGIGFFVLAFLLRFFRGRPASE
jgi:hypothetical protein